MANISDYLDWRGDIPFEIDPFGVVDNLILAELAYTDFEGIVPSVDEDDSVLVSEASDLFWKLHTTEEIMAKGSSTKVAPFLLLKLKNSKRFQNLRLMKYINIVDSANQSQFSALIFQVQPDFYYVAYRGTDNTLVGWKEDFNMGYLYQTNGQKQAVDYLNEYVLPLKGKIVLGGHSKGGNFAVYGAAFCKKEISDRMECVYSNDGPGFREKVLLTEEYQRIKERIVSIVPEDTIVGMLLSNQITHHVIQSSNQGAMQHDAMSWEVLGNHFIPAEGLSEFSQFYNRTLDTWLCDLDDEKREQFVDILFDTLEATGAFTISEIKKGGLKSLNDMAKAMNLLPKEDQKVFSEILSKLFSAGSEIYFANAKSKMKELAFNEKKILLMRKLEEYRE